MPSFRDLPTRIRYPGAIVALPLALWTFHVRGQDGEAGIWAVVQVLLVVIAAIDLETRRIPNLLTLVAAAGVMGLRVGLAPATLTETVLAGAICFVGSLLLSIVSRGALGMGDVKLSGLLGLLLGKDVVPALLVGTFCGAVAALVVARRARSRKVSLAYGPYLCVGAAILILASAPPALG